MKIWFGCVSFLSKSRTPAGRGTIVYPLGGDVCVKEGASTFGQAWKTLRERCEVTFSFGGFPVVLQ